MRESTAYAVVQLAVRDNAVLADAQESVRNNEASQNDDPPQIQTFIEGL